jgi:hypothetical protein
VLYKWIVLDVPGCLYPFRYRVGSDVLDCFYITEKNGKYGLLSNLFKCISEPVLDEILLYNPKNKWSKGMYKTSFVDEKTGKFFGAIFVMARIGEKYGLNYGMAVLSDGRILTADGRWRIIPQTTIRPTCLHH